MGVRAVREGIVGLCVLLCLLWATVCIGASLTFTWEYDDHTNITGYRIYWWSTVIKDGIPPEARSTTVEVPDDKAYGRPYTMTAYVDPCEPDPEYPNKCESERSDPVGLAPRLPKVMLENP